MRPVRFVALSEDGQALVLADEVGRLLALPIDDRISGALHSDGTPHPIGTAVAVANAEVMASLSPRDIQARIRSGESAEDVARVAGVPVDRVLRYAGPVLQERAMLAQHARRTRLKTSDSGAPLAEVVDGRLAQHGIDTEKISWDAFRREDGTWRIIATWPSGKATAQAMWDLDKGRQVVAPHDDMAQYLCAERPTQILGQEPVPERTPHERGGHGLPGPSRISEPARGGRAPADPRPDPCRPRRPAGIAGQATQRFGLGPRPGAGRPGVPPAGRRRRGSTARWRRGLSLRRRRRPAQGGPGGAEPRGAAPPSHGGPVPGRRLHRLRGDDQAPQAPAELGRRPVRRRPGGARKLLITSF